MLLFDYLSENLHILYISQAIFEGNYIKIKSYLVFIMRRRSSGPKKFGPGLGRLNFFGPDRVRVRDLPDDLYPTLEIDTDDRLAMFSV
jgi:hypothetical protein